MLHMLLVCKGKGKAGRIQSSLFSTTAWEKGINRSTFILSGDFWDHKVGSLN